MLHFKEKKYYNSVENVNTSTKDNLSKYMRKKKNLLEANDAKVSISSQID